MPDIKELRIIRIIDPNILGMLPPLRRLLKQVDGYDDRKIDTLIACGSSIITTIIRDEKGNLLRIPNPLVHIAVLVEKDGKDKDTIQGLLWAQIDVIDCQILIRLLSIDKKYQSITASNINKMITEYLFNLPIDDIFKKKIVAVTPHPKAYERIGWKRCKLTLMEINKWEKAAAQA